MLTRDPRIPIRNFLCLFDPCHDSIRNSLTVPILINLMNILISAFKFDLIGHDIELIIRCLFRESLDAERLIIQTRNGSYAIEHCQKKL